MKPLVLRAFTATSCIGRGLTATLATLRAQAQRARAVRLRDRDARDLRRGGARGSTTRRSPRPCGEFECRNNRLALPGARRRTASPRPVAECVAQVGGARVGVFLGTSTSGILDTELAYRRRDPASGALPGELPLPRCAQHLLGRRLRARALGLAGPAVVISSACSSSAKVFASAQRAIAAGARRCRGGRRRRLAVPHDALRLSLAAARRAGPCRPFDAARDGISIGEAAAFALLERPPRPVSTRTPCCCSAPASRATPTTCPRPTPRGAARARPCGARSAAARLHGRRTSTTSTSTAPARRATTPPRRAPSPPCSGTRYPGSSTKGATGHTLGAAGALEAVICALALREGFMPGGVNTHTRGPARSRSPTCSRTARRACVASEQLLRLRRLELQPGARARRVRP